MRCLNFSSTQWRGIISWAICCIVVYVALVAFTPLTERQWESLTPPAARTDSKTDVGIVLGYTLTRNGSVDTILVDRLRKGVELLVTGRVQKLMVSGGKQNHTKQADVMAEWLYRQGVAKEEVILEAGSHNTWQNAAMSLELVRQNPEWKSVIVITSSFHSVRSLAVFEWTLKKMQLQYPQWSVAIDAAEPLEGEYRPRWQGQWEYVREVGALVWYSIRNRLNPWQTMYFVLVKVLSPYLGAAIVMYVPFSFIFRTFFVETREKSKREKKNETRSVQKKKKKRN